MRPEPEIAIAAALLAWLNRKASPGEERTNLEHAEQTLRWVLGQRSALDDALVAIQRLKTLVGLPPAGPGTPRPKNPPPALAVTPAPPRRSRSGARVVAGSDSRT